MGFWRLTCTKPGATVTAWLPVPGHAPTYVVGRKEDSCDLVLLHDKAVSRVHAELEVAGGGASLKVRDVGSKFGSQLNGVRIDGTLRPVAHGDRLTLGTTDFEVAWVPLVVLVSGYKGSELEAMTQTGTSVGAQFPKDWTDDVSQLVMAKLSFTPKLLTALARAVPVVTPAWLEQLAKRTTVTEPPPNADNYAPPVPPDAAVPVPPNAGVRQVGRMSLFIGWEVVWLPGKAEGNNRATRELLKLMGATEREAHWGDGANASVQVSLARRLLYGPRPAHPQPVHATRRPLRAHGSPVDAPPLLHAAASSPASFSPRPSSLAGVR